MTATEVAKAAFVNVVASPVVRAAASNAAPQPRTAPPSEAAVASPTPTFGPEPSLRALGLEPVANNGGPALVLTPTSTTTATGVAATPTAVATATPVPTATTPPCDTAPAHPLYCTYTVQSGDTLSAIAKAFGLKNSAGFTAAEMLALSNKPDVNNADSIAPGQRLRIPVASGIIHTVFGAETLDDVATMYGVTTAAIEAVAANDVDDSGALAAGEEILVPDPLRAAPAAQTPPVVPTATPALPPPIATPTAVPTIANLLAVPSPTPTTAVTLLSIATATPTAAPATPTPSVATSKSGFIWPAQGPISSYFGPSHPLGIDIDFYADPNQPVVAAKAGTVTFAGGDPCCSYGYYVTVDHGDGFATLYAHFSKINVVAGQKVAQGQVLGLGGRTGYATGNHLHFEVHLNGAVVNPLLYLP